MYEYVRIYYRKIINRLPKNFARRFLSAFFGRAFALSCFIQTPLTRSALSSDYAFDGTYYYYTFPFICTSSCVVSRQDLGNGRLVSQVVTESGCNSTFNVEVGRGTTIPSYNVTLSQYFNFSFPSNFSRYVQGNGQSPLFHIFIKPTLNLTSSYNCILSSALSINYIEYTLIYSDDILGRSNIFSASFTPPLHGSYFIDESRIYGKTEDLNLFNFKPNGSTFPDIQALAQQGKFYILGFNTSIGYTVSSSTFTHYDYDVSFMTDIYYYSASPFFESDNGSIPVVIPGTPLTEETINQFEQSNSELMSEFDEYNSVVDSYTDDFKAAERVLSNQFTGWSWGALTQGTTWLSTQLTNFYNYSGDFKQLIVYPLLAGLALVFLGRWGSVRSSKRSHGEREWARDHNKYHGDYKK